MKYLISIPLTILPLIVYNLVGLRMTPEFWSAPVFSFTLVSGGTVTIGRGELFILAALLVLFVEIVKSTASISRAVIDHLMSMVVFVVYIIEFIAVYYCASSVFFILMMIAFIDVAAGFTVTIRSSRREIDIQRDIS